MKSIFAPINRILTLTVILFSSCGGGHDHSGHGHSSGHAHKAPHDGLLIELGDHAFNLELLFDEQTGTLGAYILGAHAEKYIPIAQKSISLALSAKGESRKLELTAVANELTGETVGNTSYFSGQSDWLKGRHTLSGVLQTVEIAGASFKDVSFDLSVHHGHAH